MSKLDIPDICAHLDRMRQLCDRLEKAQSDENQYQQLAMKIRSETVSLHAIICRYPLPTAGREGVSI